MNFSKKAFTLIEITIVIIISAILFFLLSKIYITVSKLYIYQTNYKNIEQDILFFNQNLQNLADSTEIDYSKYSNLKTNKGFTGALFLKDDNFEYKLYSSGGIIYLQKYTTGYNENIPLTSTGTNIVKKLVFKIIPFYDPFKVFTENSQQPFVTIFLTIQTRFYNPKIRYLNIKYNLEEGFNFKYYDN